MTNPTPDSGERLDSWKAIAEYLDRDIGTVRRWEKTLSLPVRRVPGGRGHSVFAYTSEIDAWLKAAPTPSIASPEPAHRRLWRGWFALAGVVALAASGIVWKLRADYRSTDDLRVEASPDAVVAFDTKGTVRWRYPFPAAYTTALPDIPEPARVISGKDPAVYVATAYRSRRSDDLAEGGALLSLDMNGELKRSFSFKDEVTFNGTEYGSPWAVTDFAVDSSAGRRRIAVAAHHLIWYPSIVTLLDDEWRRRATFIHAGWIEGVHWIEPNRLLVAGFSESQDGGMVALLDPDNLDGQGPEPAGSPYYCETCGKVAVLRMIAMPRTEVNRITASRFNRARFQVTADRIVVRTIEVPSPEVPVDALYEFTPNLDLITASFSKHYWEIHRALELEGKIKHTAEQCPDRDGPREIRVWEPGTGWRTQSARLSSTPSGQTR